MPPGIAIGLRTDMMIGNWIGSSVASSSWAEVAEDEHGVVGMLFGNVKGQPAIGTHHSPIWMEMRMILSLVFGSYGSFARMFRLMASFMMTDLKLLLYDPRTDAEITMLIVGGAHRGKGLGKKFVQRFIDAAKSQGARSRAWWPTGGSPRGSTRSRASWKRHAPTPSSPRTATRWRRGTCC